MPRFDVVKTTPIVKSFRVDQVRGMFDVPDAGDSAHRITVELPDDDKWSIGLIVGPSGSGKSTLAAEVWPDKFHAPKWDGRAIVDNFAGDVRSVCEVLTSVGLSSPPSWIKPYHVLSNGEKFRADLARTISESDGISVVDEFTSVIDRTVAKVASYATSKAVRKSGKKLVALSCHYDIAEWLEPDWVLDLATCQLARGRLCRPKFRFTVERCGTDWWRVFGRHHYLSASLHKASRCYLARFDGQPCGFAAVLPVIGMVGKKRIHRVVTLPDYQGIGVGFRLLDAVAADLKPTTLHLNTSNTFFGRAMAKSPTWIYTGSTKAQANKTHKGKTGDRVTSTGRITMSFRHK